MRIDPARLVEARLARAMSQEEAAIAADLSPRTIQRIEAGHPASLESTKALLTIFGAHIIHDPEVVVGQRQGSPWRDAWGAIGFVIARSASVGFDGVRLGFAAVLLLIAVAKPFVPRQAGLWVHDGHQFELGLLARSPDGARELLGYAIIPAMIVATALVLLTIGRVRRLAWPIVSQRLLAG